MLEDVSSRNRRVLRKKLQIPVFAPQGGARLRAGCPRASGSQRQSCGGCVQFPGLAKVNVRKSYSFNHRYAMYNWVSVAW